MSRIAKNPITLPTGVSVTQQGQSLMIKGAKITLQHEVHPLCEVIHEGNILKVTPRQSSIQANALSGTEWALISNKVIGVTLGFTCEMVLMGVGYRAQGQGKKLNLTLGFSHPVQFEIPDGIQIETPTATDIVIKGADRYLVKQVAANIRAFRPPERYKGKGIRYKGEVIKLKETKKK